MEAILPDLNTGYIKYRNKVMDSIDSRKYNNCFGALYAINGLLPKEYQITISDSLYNDSIKQSTLVLCNHCKTSYETKVGDETITEERPTEHDYQNIRIYQIMLPMISSFVSGIEYDKVWDCSKCNKTNRLEKTRFAKNVLKEPYFLKVMPKPPQRKDGLIDRASYHKKVKKWVWTFLDELEHQMGEYRRNYVPKEQQQEEENQYNQEEEEI